MHSLAVEATVNTGKDGIAFRLPLDRFQHLISPATCQSLVQHGYAVVDNLFGSTWSQQLKEELVQLKQQGRMHLNTTHLVQQDSTKLLEKQHVYEAELRDEACSLLLSVDKALQNKSPNAVLPGVYAGYSEASTSVPDVESGYHYANNVEPLCTSASAGLSGHQAAVQCRLMSALYVLLHLCIAAAPYRPLTSMARRACCSEVTA